MLESVSRAVTRVRHIQSLIGEPSPSNEEFGRVLDRVAPSEDAKVSERSRKHERAKATKGKREGTGPFPDRPVGSCSSPFPAFVISSEPFRADLRPLIEEAAAKTGLSGHLISAVIAAESGFRPDAVSPAGALGLMQLMPATARALGVDDPLDPRQNVLAGTEYLRQQLHRFGTVEKALAAYNAGPGAVVRHGGVPPYRETENYVQRVMGLLRRWSGLRG
jgi:hypothetical protein